MLLVDSPSQHLEGGAVCCIENQNQRFSELGIVFSVSIFVGNSPRSRHQVVGRYLLDRSGQHLSPAGLGLLSRERLNSYMSRFTRLISDFGAC